MLTYIKINGFKSFHNFEMEFTPFTVIAGINASGKSNLFDALTLLKRLAETDIKTAFSEQRGNPFELFTQYGENQYALEMEFIVEMLLNRKITDTWGGEEELNYTRLRYHLIIERKQNHLKNDDLYVKHESLEKIKPESDKWINNILSKKMSSLAKNLRAGGSSQPYIRTEPEGNKIAIKIRQDGKQGGKASPANAISQTVLSAINSVDFKHVFAAKKEMLNWLFIQFNPEDLREPTKKDIGLKDVITKSGKNLAAVLFRIKQEDAYTLKEIARNLQLFLPNFTSVIAVDDVANNQYLIKLQDKDKKEYTSRVLSEGTLRILALCILKYDDKHTGLLCFEEPENGIHPQRIKDMVSLLKDLSVNFTDTEMPLRQVIVNTHSPVFVGNIYTWENDTNVSLWFAQMRNRITDIDGKRTELSITSILPVVKDNTKQLSLEFSEQERKLTLSTVNKYLETTTNFS
jgi:predicted ATPase